MRTKKDQMEGRCEEGMGPAQEGFPGDKPHECFKETLTQPRTTFMRTLCQKGDVGEKHETKTQFLLCNDLVGEMALPAS